MAHVFGENEEPGWIYDARDVITCLAVDAGMLPLLKLHA